MNNLYEALEICLQNIEQGADIDTVLLRYPDLASELRPILEASRDAHSLVVSAPSQAVVRRNRARVLQRAAQLREAKVRSSRRIWFASLRRVAVTLAVVGILFASGTGLVRAASTTLPGDQLYPVKRTWEDVLVMFALNSQQRDALEVEHENERLQELQELFAEKRSVEVEFAGLVTSQNGTDWVVSGIPVVVSAQVVQGQNVVAGSAVQIKGHTQANGAVLADQVELLPPGSKLPDMENEHEQEDNSQGGSNSQIRDGVGEKESPRVEQTETPASGSGGEDGSLNDGSSKNGDSGSHDNKDGGSDSSSHEDGSGSGGGDSSSGEGGD